MSQAERDQPQAQDHPGPTIQAAATAPGPPESNLDLSLPQLRAQERGGSTGSASSSSSSSSAAAAAAAATTPSSGLVSPQSGARADERVEHDRGYVQESVKVYNPVSSSSATDTAPTDPPEDFFEPTLADVQSHHASVLARNKRLNEAPLLTSKHRDAEKAEKEKAKRERWPNTTIRIKFSDGTIIQNVFPSNSPTALRDEVREKPFILWQPPRTRYPEHPTPPPAGSKPTKSTPSYAKTSIIPPANYGFVRGGVVQGLQGGTGGKESLFDLGLVPQSVLMVKFDEDDMNASAYPAPIRDDLKAHSEPLPAIVPREAPKSQPSSTAGAGGQTSGAGAGEKKIPKWLQKGLLKKKT
ncbi:hypothetical protein I316_00069 [Kwoniella heveanensis BCC8398]|uniref:UBX domain-containing protein n=1 Tax=Kwoniella heveanensis BCC8398 TaxID=1296120 RepID=A0A1B9H3K4_9TREE|nr:hypothetical protein I316_00069 [Kwoniella heveanensis BCC8398]